MRRNTLVTLLVALVVTAAVLYGLYRIVGLSSVEPGTGQAPKPAATAGQPTTTPTPKAKTTAENTPTTTAKAPTTPSFDVVRVAHNCNAVIAGRAAPGATVTVKAGDQVIGTAKTDTDGSWVLVPAKPLESGSRALHLVQVLPGQAPVKSQEVVVVSVPKCGSSQQALAVLSPTNNGPSRVLQGPNQGAVHNKGLSLNSADYDDQGNLALSGKAPSGAEVRVYLDDHLIGRALANKNGDWQLALNKKLAAGLHDLRIDQVTPKGKVVARIEVPFQRPASATFGHLALGQVVVQPGNSLWRIARRTYGHGIRYTIIYEANRSQIRNPNLIYPGQVFSLPTLSEPSKSAPAKTAGSRD